MSLQTILPRQSIAKARPLGEKPPAWLRHIGLLNDYVRIPFANGSSFASQFLYREFRKRGHQVTVVGPNDPEAESRDFPERFVLLPALPLRNHPGVRMPLPGARALARAAAQRFDLVLGNTSSELTDLGIWLRATQHIPFVAVNTLHLRSAYNVVLPDLLAKQKRVTDLIEAHLLPAVERHSANVYNEGDGLIVLSSGLARFWRERGVTTPIHVVQRSVDPKIFDESSGRDPFSPRAKRGGRLLVVCRHVREKSLDRLLGIFARAVAPRFPDATLTLVGDGPDHESLRQLAAQLGIAERTFFTGEHPVTAMPAFYRHADLFLYASLSETYGQVVSEALWCGLPAVAFADDMGVSDQIDSGTTGYLLRPGPDAEEADRAFGAAVVHLLEEPSARRQFSARAAQMTRARVHPRGIIQRYYDVFEQAREHNQRTLERRVADPYAGYRAIGRWASMQSLALLLGCMRKPAVVNRHGRKQPAWDALER
jgi:1,2-diacylglycerol 3-alpha-glucosyltransferase